MEWLPPGWSSAFSKTRGKIYYFKGEHTQWNLPTWDDEIAASYAHQTPNPTIKPFRSLQNYIKNCILYYYIFSNKNIHSILDIACGKGGDVHKIPSTYKYIGIDICAESLAEAKKRHPTRDFLQASFHSKINIHNYESAMCMFALHYGGDMFLQTLKNIRATLIKDAFFVFVVLDEEKIKKYPEGYGPLKILKIETRSKQLYRASQRIFIKLAGVADSTPEFILDKELIQETASVAGFEIVAHQSTLQVLKEIGLGEWMDPTTEQYKIRSHCEELMKLYEKNWDGVVWSFADMYKVVVLKAN